MQQYAFEVSFSNCKDFLNDKLRHGFKYVNHISSGGTVILILEMEDLV